MIISASRRTDIPNYYSEWFFHRLEEGFVYVRNPYNPCRVSKIALCPETVDCLVFWTKNPAPMLGSLDRLSEYPYYFQFTVIGYGPEVEPGLPDKEKILGTFRDLSRQVGKDRVIWRYDPVFLNSRYTMSYHIAAFQDMAKELEGFTNRVVISFLDFYSKTKRNMTGISAVEMKEAQMFALAEKIACAAAEHGMIVESCAEEMDLEQIGICHGSCIDRELIEKLTRKGLSGKKDKNQRKECRCMESVDIGAYHTCLNGCRYCYANFSRKRVENTVRKYEKKSPVLCGQITAEDTISNRT